MDKSINKLTPAIRQYRHNTDNDGSQGFVIAYDKEETDKAFEQIQKEVEYLQKRIDELNEECDGLMSPI